MIDRVIDGVHFDWSGSGVPGKRIGFRADHNAQPARSRWRNHIPRRRKRIQTQSRKQEGEHRQPEPA